MARILPRMLRASLLDANLYEEVEADRGATGQAFLVVLISAVAAGIGSFDNSGLPGIFWSSVAALVGWYVWAYVTYFIGTRFLPTHETVADHGELLRTIGFSSAPGVLRILALIPAIAFLSPCGADWPLMVIVPGLIRISRMSILTSLRLPSVSASTAT